QVGRFNQLFLTGTFRNDSRMAEAFGIQPLRGEKSRNASAGVTSKISNRIHLTLDAYWIQIRNRIIFTGPIQRNNSTPRVGKILDSLNHRDINAVRFFTNAISTRTQGIDAVVTGNWPIHKSVLEILVSANFTRTRVYGSVQSAKNLPDSVQYRDVLFNVEERGRIEQGQPRNKIILSAIYKTGKWEFATRAVRFGKVASIYNGSDRSFDEVLSPKVNSGFRIAYAPKPWITVTAGAMNIFNVYPDRLKNYINSMEGILLYSDKAIQFGNNGIFYFMNMEFNL
ncbi:MAG: TonB-dependent receptor, partial [Flavisolibacter sp.]|nr:TonB-dependent receptor [Flavisolibacter sp.]